MTVIRAFAQHYRITGQTVHGGGRRVTSRDPVYRIDPAELAEFNRGTQRAIRANHDREARERNLEVLYDARSVQ